MSIYQEGKSDSIRDCFLNYLKNPEQNDSKLIAKLNNMKDTWISERDKTNARVWRNSNNFYAGNHYIRDNYNVSNSYKVRLRENHINNIMNRMLSIMGQNLPIVRVFPSSDSSQDVQDAQNTEMYGKYFWREKKIEQQMMKLIKYSLIFGNAFAYKCWNPDLGGKISLSEADSEGGEKTVEMYRGDIEVNIDDPFKVAVRPGIEEWLNHYDVIRSVPVSRAMIESKHGRVEADPAVTMNSQTGDLRVDDDNIVMHSYWHKPTPWFEEGMYVCWVGKKILKARPATKAEVDLPLTFLGFDKVPMKFWHLSSIEQVMDLQEQLNRAASMIIEARNLVARPRVFASNEAKVPAQSLSDRPGEIIRYAQAGGAPTFVNPSFNFNEMANHKADVRNAMSAVMGITSASRGEIPSATRTALALQLVLEQDRSQYLPFIKSIHQCVLDVMSGIFQEAACNLDENDPRTIKIEGKISTTRTFHGGMVPSPLDIYLEDTNPLGWTAGSRIENVYELAKLGVVTDKNQILEMLHLRSADPAFEYANINRQTQQKEIQMFEKGEFVNIGPADDDAIHIEELNKVMASFEFKFKPLAIQEAYMQHRDAHKARQAQMQAEEAAKQQGGGIREAGAQDPAAAMAAMQAPMPGQNIEELLGSARAG